MTFNGSMEMQGQLLNCYAPGDGSLDFTWMSKEYPNTATGREVLQWHVNRFLKTKEGKRLTSKGYKPYNINGQWTLVCTVVRKNKNTLLMDGELYTYKMEYQGLYCDLTIYSKYPKSVEKLYAGKLSKFEVNNWSIRSTIHYFLNHEKELRRADKNNKKELKQAVKIGIHYS